MPCLIAFRASVAEAGALVRAQSALVQERVLVVSFGDRIERAAAAQLVAAGASEVLVWTGEIAAIAARLERWGAVDALLASDPAVHTLIGTSPAWSRVLREVIEVARFTDAPVLVTGETGTGKELVSRLVHALDARAGKRELVLVDCTTIVPELSGSEFFGHEKGSFTGAVAARNGAFALADEGTLFLDEVGELPLVLQAELLRVIQEHTFKRVGGNVWQSTRFRLVCATNRDLEVERREGRFRSDLFYRIAGWTVSLPPLADRREDILPLARHFLGEQLGHPIDLDDTVAEHIVRREFRGNIRELRQLCARIAHRHVGPGPITLGDLGAEFAPGDGADGADGGDGAWCDRAFRRSIARAVAMGVNLKEIGRVAEDVAVQLAVSSENGSLQNAARRLGVTDRALQLRRASARGTAQPSPSGATDETGKHA
ncbi:MAG TPA: sigma 54-interacting transcriptional regulator [Kofleriaceae bacterium]|nr:sigma 54-interacting transcriptional regulator [Kofleriaceae bacterium]